MNNENKKKFWIRFDGFNMISIFYNHLKTLEY